MNRAVFLDRDGTINKDVGYLHEKDKFEYIEGAVEGLRAIQNMGYLLVIITNQSGIARGLFTEKEYLELEGWIEDELRSKCITIAGSYYCPHHPEAIIPEYRVRCDCRKPETGLFRKAASGLDIDLDNSYAVGDKMRDLCICSETKTQGLLLNNREVIPEGCKNIRRCRDWGEVVEAIRAKSKRKGTL